MQARDADPGFVQHPPATRVEGRLVISTLPPPLLSASIPISQPVVIVVVVVVLAPKEPWPSVVVVALLRIPRAAPAPSDLGPREAVARDGKVIAEEALASGTPPAVRRRSGRRDLGGGREGRAAPREAEAKNGEAFHVGLRA